MHYEIVDIRTEIEEYERTNRFWPRSGSVSKPFIHDYCDPWYRFMLRWSDEDLRKARIELAEESFYKYHHRVLIRDIRDASKP